MAGSPAPPSSDIDGGGDTVPNLALHVSMPNTDADFPIAATVRQVLAGPRPAGWQPSGRGRAAYLDLAERIVRGAAPWQDATGAIVDPNERKECGQSTPRFAAPGAILLASGRIPELAEPVYRAMDTACRRLPLKDAPSPDFWMRELMTALICLRGKVESARWRQWAADLSTVIPERVYQFVKPDGKDLHTLHNWVVYASAGEAMRARLDLAPADPETPWGDGFFDKYMPSQLTHMTEEGLYRDPGDPMTYDSTTRLQMATALAFGYAGPLREAVDRRLQRGALTMLLTLSPDGLTPFGGRSAEYHFREAITAALCELEARRWREADPALAGAFKRQAHLSVAATERWLQADPWRALKNSFPPSSSFGCDIYGVYSTYSLLTASFLGLAALYADETIPEAPCPAELGGYVLQLDPAFRKVFASVGDTQIEIDTAADQTNDATGLGRFSRRGVPIELGPGMPMAGHPKFRLPKEQNARNEPAGGVATGPAWQLSPAPAAGAPAAPASAPAANAADEVDWRGWRSLAAVGRKEMPPLRHVSESVSPSRCAFRLGYTLAAASAASAPDTAAPDAAEHLPVTVEEHYDLQAGGRLVYRAAVQLGGAPVPRLRLVLPILHSDGEAEATLTLAPGSATVRHRGATWRAAYPAVATVLVDRTPLANRHGLYHRLVLETTAAELQVVLQLDPAAT